MSATPEAIANSQQELFDQVCQMTELVQEAALEGRAAHKVEERIWRWVLQFGHNLLGMFFDLCGDADMGERVLLPDGTEAKRLDKPHTRRYLSVFGEFELARRVYGTREGQKILYVPLDARLNLPASKFSYLLQDWDQVLEVEMPFDQVVVLMERILGFKQSVHSLERTEHAAAQDVAGFWQEQPAPDPAQEGKLLVCSADGKGVPMRAAAAPESRAERCPGAGQEEKGMRPGTKKMALVGAAYTIDPFVRTPQDVLAALFRDPQEAPLPRPKPCGKAVRACLQRDEDDTTAPQIESIFSWLAAHAKQRAPADTKPLIVLMDGQESLWDAANEYLPGTEVTEILDLLHAIQYLWEAAHLFFRRASTEARAFVREQMRRMLHGDIKDVIGWLRHVATEHKLQGKPLDDLERICGYFTNNIHRMAYDQYLAHGFPIASGVIEGACRCIVKDRMERSGMRWLFAGAQSMLSLRSIHLSGLWDEFITFRIECERKRLYPLEAANDDRFSLPLAA